MMGWFSKSKTNAVRSPSLSQTTYDEAVELSDEELLHRFSADADDRAFEQLVARHGGMVLAVCRRLTGNHADAEDAFQAAFMVLARKAASVRRAGSLPAWLHKTAFRVALRAKSWRKSRREQPLEDESMITAESLEKIAVDYDESVLDEELNRLPDKYRLPLFLCCVEGRSVDAAAKHLGWTVGSVKGRLERGRRELRRRLLTRRVTVASGLAALACLASTTSTASAAVAPSLVASTVQAGMQFAACRTPLGYVSHNALSLANGSLSIMSISSIKFVVAVVAAGLFAWGGTQIPASAVAGGNGGSQDTAITLQSSVSSANVGGEVAGVRLALADEPRREGAAPREGDRPAGERREGAARDGERPAAGPRDGERPVAGPRDGERRPAEGERAPARDGERPAANPLADFKPQTQREEVLYQMIIQLQREMGAMRAQLQAREGGRVQPRRDGEGEGVRRPETRDGEGARRPEARDGERPRTGPRDGEAPKAGPRDGERPAAGPRDGERPAAPREGERGVAPPKKEGDG